MVRRLRAQFLSAKNPIQQQVIGVRRGSSKVDVNGFFEFPLIHDADARNARFSTEGNLGARHLSASDSLGTPERLSSDRWRPSEDLQFWLNKRCGRDRPRAPPLLAMAANLNSPSRMQA